MKSTGKMKNSKGNKDHDRQFHGLLLGPLPAFDPHDLRLDPQHAADGDAVGVGLDYRLDKAAQLRDVRPLGQRLVRLAAAAAHLHVLQGPDQFLRQRALAVLARPGHGTFEAEARFHGDEHLVQGVGQFQLHGLLALLALAVEQEVGNEVAQQEHKDPTSLRIGVGLLALIQKPRRAPSRPRSGLAASTRPSGREAGRPARDSSRSSLRT